MTQPIDWGSNPLAGALRAIVESNSEEAAYARARESMCPRAFDRLHGLLAARVLRRAYGYGRPENIEDAFSLASAALFARDRTKWPINVQEFEHLWLRIIRYQAAKLHRTQIRRREVSMDSIGECPSDTDFTEEILSRVYTHSPLAAALQTLTDREAAVVEAAVLVKERGQTQEVAAYAMGLDPRRFRHLLWNARRKLKRRLFES